MNSYDLALLKGLPPGVVVPTVSANSVLADGMLRFEVRVNNAKLNVRANPSKEPIWGLWDFDVFEVFLSTAQEPGLVPNAPYYEFQVSPFSQYFELKVFEPRRKVDQAFRSGMTYGAAVKTTQAWSGWMQLSLEALGLDPAKPLYGGLFACLLREPHRAYLGFQWPAQEKLDFHVPRLFVPL